MFNKKSIQFLAVLGLSAAFIGTAGFGDDHDKKKVALGEEVPAWTLTDMDGKTHSSTDFAGKTVVIEWTNPDCPFIVGVYQRGVVKDTLNTLKELGDDHVYIAVNSTANMPKDAVIKGNKEFLKNHEVSIPVLIDYEGTVGRTFGAKHTPHMYVIDSSNVLRYEGAFTDSPRGPQDGATETNYVVNALRQIKNGETVTPDHVKAWGCSVKYAAKAKDKSMSGGAGGSMR